MAVRDLQALFEQQFSRAAEWLTSAPGRVNLLGEHTDYNAGFVFPAAIDRQIRILASPRHDSLVRAFSIDYDQTSEFRLESIDRSAEAPWSNYLRGVLHQFVSRGVSVSGADVAIKGDVPIGAGLSSSAAFEVAAAETFRQMYGIPITPVEMALLAQAAENRFVGVQCGIMDQFVSVLAEAESALLIDCRDLSYSVVKLQMDARIIVCDSRVQRSLDASAYNERRTQCEQAVAAIRARYPEVLALRDVRVDQLEMSRDLLTDVLYRRARHVVSENERVLTGVELLRRGNVSAFGELLFASHASLRDDYEVSCPELDLLVDLASSQEGTLGARMTGAGFGGCTVNLVASRTVEDFCERVAQSYREGTNLEPAIYVCRPSPGVTSKRL